MKKLLTLFLMLFLQNSVQVFALEPQKTLNLHSGNVYVMSIDSRPKNIEVTNPAVVEVTSTSDSFTQTGQLVFNTLQEGISYVTYKHGRNNASSTIKVLVDNHQAVDASVIELDIIKDATKDK